MPIYVAEGPEPLSQRSLDGAECPIIESHASRLLTAELLRYCRQEIGGRSFLIAGHRGAGKTTVVAKSVLDAVTEYNLGKISQRPLHVLLHGPSLFPDEDDATWDLAGQTKPRQASTKEPTAKKAGKGSSEAASPAKGEQRMTDATRALMQITLALHRAVAREFSREYRRVSPQAQNGGPGSPEIRELAATLETELYEGASPALLRAFWERGGFLDSGILPAPGGSLPRGRGAQELVALSGICEAYKRISGVYTYEERIKDEVERRVAASVDIDTASKALAPIVSLLSGGLVGSGLYATGLMQGGGATVAGIASALAATTVFKMSASRRQSKEASRELSYRRTLNADTLHRELPVYMDRLRGARLAPVFVVDELDKVTDLWTRIPRMVHYLKKLVAESAFFCFLVDRTYFEQVLRRGQDVAYPVEYTYYTHRLWVSFAPADLHAYLAGREEAPSISGVLRAGPPSSSAGLGTPPPSAALGPTPGGTSMPGMPAPSWPDREKELADITLLPYVLLHRSRMHPIDLKRELADLQDEQRGARLRTPGKVRSEPDFLLELRIQFAIEMQLARSLDKRIERIPEFRRLAYDALYYISRKWEEDHGNPLDLSDAGAPLFKEYLVARLGKEPLKRADAGQHLQKTDPPPPLEVTDADSTALLEEVRRLAFILSDHSLFLAEVKQWNAERERENKSPMSRDVIDALEVTPAPGQPELVLLVERRKHVYAWRFDRFGNALVTTASPIQKPAAPKDEDDASFVEGFANLLDEVVQIPDSKRAPGEVLDWMQTLLHVIPTSPAWEVVREIITRLKNPAQAKTEGELGILSSFADLLSRTTGVIGLALVCGASAGRFARGGKTRDNVLQGLLALSNYSRFSELDQDRVVAHLEAFQKAAHDLGVEPSKPAPPARGAIEHDGVYRQWLESEFQRAYHAPKQLEEDAIARGAWKNVAARVRAFLGTAPYDEAADPWPLEVAAAVAGAQSQIVPFHLEQATIVDWSAIYLKTFEADFLSAPPWLGVAALLALGFPVNIDGLEKRFDATRKDSKTPLASAVENPFSDLPRRPGARRAVLIVYRSMDSMVRAWMPSRQTAAFGVMAPDANKFIREFTAPAPKLFDVPSLFAFEQPNDDSKIRGILSDAKKAKRPIVFFYETRPEGRVRERYIIGPRSVDDLFPPEITHQKNVPAERRAR